MTLLAILPGKASVLESIAHQLTAGAHTALAFFWKGVYGNTEKSGLLFAQSVAGNSILLGTVGVLGTLIFGGVRTGPIYAVFFFAMYPFTVGALPTFYSLAASYFVALDRGYEVGAMFGALSVWVALGEYISVCLDLFLWSSRF